MGQRNDRPSVWWSNSNCYTVLELSTAEDKDKSSKWRIWMLNWVSRTIAKQLITLLFSLIFLSKHISLYAIGRFKWTLDIIWNLNQHFKLKNQRNWLKQVWMLNFWRVINCIFVHWTKKLTLVYNFFNPNVLVGSSRYIV